MSTGKAPVSVSASFPADADLKKMQSFEDIGLQAAKIDEMVTALKGQ